MTQPAVLLLALAPLAAPQGTDELAARLERLETQLEERRVELHVAGMALSVVKDDEVVLARGFGLADVEADEPATEQTLFAIGSATKAFTAALTGTLVDEGLLTWDEPVHVVLPEFELHVRSKDPEARPTLRDLLAHRTGFARADLLWASGRAAPAQVLATITRAEPWTGFREEFVYNNIMFLAAGEACAVAAEQPWGELLRARLLEPLGMASTTWTRDAAQADERLAKGYVWIEEREEFEHRPMRDLRSVAPAGAINSNVLDMAQWVRLQLGRGELEGRRVLPEAVVRESWTPQMEVGGGASYGLGWFLREWRGRRVVEHGGNIDGFAAQVAFLPDDGVGYVLLTNVSATPLQTLSQELVWEALLGDPRPEGAPEASDHTPYLGRYLANFASFEDAIFEVSEQDGKLAVDVPGQMNYTLKEPDADGRWVFELTEQIAVTFQRDDEGNVVSLTMHQAGLSFEAPREGWEPPAEIDLDDARRYLGGYEHSAFDVPLQVSIQRSRLAIDIPGQMLCELHTPDDEGWRVFRVNELLAVRFQEQDGRVSGLEFRERGQVLECPRVEGAAAGEAVASITLEELHALRRSDERAAALQALGAWRMRGDLRLVHAGIEGRLTMTAHGDDRHRIVTDLSPFLTVDLAYDRGRGTSTSDIAEDSDLTPDQLEWLRVDHPAMPFGDWRAWFDSIRVLRAEERGGRATWVVRLEAGEGVAFTVWVDAETGDTLFEEYDQPIGNGAGALHRVRSYSDHREVEGLRVAHGSAMEDDVNGRVEFALETLEAHLELPVDAFRSEIDQR